MSRPKKSQPAQTGALPKEVLPATAERYAVYLLLLLAALLALYVRGRLLGLPLERDEGEYAYMGQLILNGIPPYAEAFNMKLPGTYYIYALFMGIFGQSPEGIHIGLLISNIISIVFLFIIGKKTISPIAGAVAALSYAILSATQGTYGMAAHASHYNVLFGLGGFWALLSALESNKLKWIAASGLLFGLSFVMKQQAVFLVLFGGIVLLIREFKRSPRAQKTSIARLSVFALAAALPYLCTVFVALATGTFDQFWHWTVEYAYQYAGIKTWDKAAKQFMESFRSVVAGAEGLWALGLAGAIALYFTAIDRHKRLILLLFAGFSFLCVCPGFYFRNHYFIVFLPALSLLAGVAVQLLRERATKFRAPAMAYLAPVLFVLITGSSLYAHRKFFFTYSTDAVCTWLYGSNPFSQTWEIARFIQKNSAETDRVAVLGSEPQVYFYSKRKAATGFLYVYPLMENQPYSAGMQQQMIADIEQNRPRYIVFVNAPHSWLLRPESSPRLMQWFEQYSAAYYGLKGVADIIGPGNTRYVWNEAALQYKAQGQASVFVLERKQ